ncbi:hypothetical protein [Chroococcidiopsis cubana]|nr:hypothetical protein [Chroococcidiopsis cubana]
MTQIGIGFVKRYDARSRSMLAEDSEIPSVHPIATPVLGGQMF